MILPQLLAGYGLWTQWLARLAAKWRPVAGEIVMAGGLGLVAVSQLSYCGIFIGDQHGVTRSGIKPFYQVYENGGKIPIIDLAQMIRKTTRPNVRIIGPEATIVTYLSGRETYGLRSVLPPNWKAQWPRIMRAQRFTYCVFPISRAGARAYMDADNLTHALIGWSLIQPAPGEFVGTTRDFGLARFKLNARRPPRHERVRGVRPRRARSGAARKVAASSRPAPGSPPATGRRPSTAPAASRPQRRTPRVRGGGG
jgi:hypothetical protein